MKRSRIWIIVLASSVCCGILLGTVLFVIYNQGQDVTEKTGGQEETPDQVIQIVTDESVSEPGSDKTEEGTEPGTLEAEDFSGYYGTYVPRDGRNLMVDLDGNGIGVSKPHLISEKALLYIDMVKRSEDGEELLGYVNYFGLCQWVSLEELEKVSEKDYSIHIGDECAVCEDWSVVNLMKQPQKDSGIYNVAVHTGDILKVLDVENGYFETACYDSAAKTSIQGWMNGDYVTKFYTELPYQMICNDSNDTETIPFYRNLPDSADIVLEDADGCIGEGSVLWFRQFADGWGLTDLNGQEAWIRMMDAIPVSEQQKQSVLSYAEFRKELEGRTDFYKDGRTVTAEEYILPEAQQRILTDQDLNNLTLKGLSYAKNELYAKYGRKFESKELSDYMKSKTWYVPLYEARTYDDLIVSKMNEYERKNIAFLNAKESALGPYEYD